MGVPECVRVCDSNSREALTVVNVISDMCVWLRGRTQAVSKAQGSRQSRQAKKQRRSQGKRQSPDSSQVSRRLSGDPQRVDSGATKSAGFVQYGSRNAAPLIELGPGLDVVDTLESQTAFSFRRTASVICTWHTGDEGKEEEGRK